MYNNGGGVGGAEDCTGSPVGAFFCDVFVTVHIDKTMNWIWVVLWLVTKAVLLHLILECMVKLLIFVQPDLACSLLPSSYHYFNEQFMSYYIVFLFYLASSYCISNMFTPDPSPIDTNMPYANVTTGTSFTVSQQILQPAESNAGKISVDFGDTQTAGRIHAEILLKIPSDNVITGTNSGAA